MTETKFKVGDIINVRESTHIYKFSDDFKAIIFKINTDFDKPKYNLKILEGSFKCSTNSIGDNIRIKGYKTGRMSIPEELISLTTLEISNYAIY